MYGSEAVWELKNVNDRSVVQMAPRLGILTETPKRLCGQSVVEYITFKKRLISDQDWSLFQEFWIANTSIFGIPRLWNSLGHATVWRSYYDQLSALGCLNGFLLSSTSLESSFVGHGVNCWSAVQSIALLCVPSPTGSLLKDLITGLNIQLLTLNQAWIACSSNAEEFFSQTP